METGLIRRGRMKNKKVHGINPVFKLWVAFHLIDGFLPIPWFQARLAKVRAVVHSALKKAIPGSNPAPGIARPRPWDLKWGRLGREWSFKLNKKKMSGSVTEKKPLLPAIGHADESAWVWQQPVWRCAAKHSVKETISILQPYPNH